jgi:hypothetical protein
MPLLNHTLIERWSNAVHPQDNTSARSIASDDSDDKTISHRRGVLRRVSDVLDYVSRKKMDKTDAESNVTNDGQLVEDWPRRRSCSSSNGSNESALKEPHPQRRKSSFLNTSSKTLKTPKRVSFTQYSRVREYEVSRTHRKSYTHEDEQAFRNEALMDALRIRDAIASHPDVTATNPVKRLIELNLLATEEMVGIEDKIVDLTGMKKALEYKAHATFLLDHQDELRRNNDEGYAEKLAHAAAASSSASARKARARAALAA